MKSTGLTRKTVGIILLSFLMPIMLFIAIWASRGIWWGSDITPLTYDLQIQYLPFIASLRYVLTGDASLFYNPSISMGGNYLSVLAYYGASPLNLITLLFDIEEMANAIYLLTLLKIGLCGLNFAVYLRWGTKEKKESFAIIVFACCYALSSYNVLYSMNIMWLDGIALLPLTLLGVEQIFQGKRGLLYCLSIGMTFFTNYYLSYIIGIFTAVYFIAKLVTRWSEVGKKDRLLYVFRFGYGTIVGGMLSAILLIPAIMGFLAVPHTKATSGSVDIMYQFGIVEFLKKFLPQQYDSLTYTGLPPIYCGLLVPVLCVIFFASKRKLNDKIRVGLLMLLPMLGFAIPTVDKTLHGFRTPHGFLYRYAFCFVFVLVATAYDEYLMITVKTGWKSILCRIAVVYTVAELFLNGAAIVTGIDEEVHYSTRDLYVKTTKVFGELAAYMEQDENYYRLGENTLKMTQNNSIMFGVNGIDSSSSTYNDDVATFLTKMGANHTLGVDTISAGLSHLMDSLLGVKYRIELVDDVSGYKVIAKKSEEPYNGYLLGNSDAVSIGLSIPKNQDGKSMEYTWDCFENQNKFVLQLVDLQFPVYDKVQNILVETEDMKHTLCGRFDGKREQFLCLDVIVDLEKKNLMIQTEEDYYNSWIVISVDGNAFTGVFVGDNRLGIIENKQISLGKNVDAGEHVVTIETPAFCKIRNAQLYEYDETAYRAVIDTLATREMNITDSKKSIIAGTIDIHEGERFFASIPNIDGIEIWSDGEKKAVDEDVYPFIAADLGEGKHTVEVRYSMPGKTAGTISFIFGLILLTNYYFFVYFFCKKSQKALAE